MYQTRSETTGSQSFANLAEAIKAAELDNTIWKISFQSKDDDRIRLIKRICDGSNFWVLENIL